MFSSFCRKSASFVARWQASNSIRGMVVAPGGAILDLAMRRLEVGLPWRGVQTKYATAAWTFLEASEKMIKSCFEFDV